MAKKLFPNTDAVGQHIRYTIAPRDSSPNDFEVVGVVGTHRHDVQNDAVLRRMFVPLAVAQSGNVYLNVRIASKERRAVAAMVPAVREIQRTVDPDLAI